MIRDLVRLLNIDKESLFIQKLYVTPPLWRSFEHHKLTIGRNSVIEITEKAIIVSGPEQLEESETKSAKSQIPAAYASSSSASNSATNE